MAKDEKASAPPTDKGIDEGDRVVYRAREGVHLTQAGPVALSNWVGRYGNRNVRVYRGAPAADLPEAIVAAMAKDGVRCGKVSYEDLGLAPPAAARGAQIISVE